MVTCSGNVYRNCRCCLDDAVRLAAAVERNRNANQAVDVGAGSLEARETSHIRPEPVETAQCQRADNAREAEAGESDETANQISL